VLCVEMHGFVEGVGAEFGLCVECVQEDIEGVLPSGSAVAYGGGVGG
jgi:hypothetical protein